METMISTKIKNPLAMGVMGYLLHLIAIDGTGSDELECKFVDLSDIEGADFTRFELLEKSETQLQRDERRIDGERFYAVMYEDPAGDRDHFNVHLVYMVDGMNDQISKRRFGADEMIEAANAIYDHMVD